KVRRSGHEFGVLAGGGEGGCNGGGPGSIRGRVCSEDGTPAAAKPPGAVARGSRLHGARVAPSGARPELGRSRMMLAGVPGARRRLGSRDGRERGEEQEREGGEDSWPEAAHPLRVGRKLRLSELDDRNLDGWESPALRLAPAPGYRV